MTELEKLKQFMKPFYQTLDDETLLNAYLEKYTYAECAAAALWAEKAGEVAFEDAGLSKVSTGAEKFEFSAPSSMYDLAMKQSKYYEKLCRDLHGIGSVAVPIAKPSVGGVTEEYR